jgi:tetraacyldisaccharide 4'-kinase
LTIVLTKARKYGIKVRLEKVFNRIAYSKEASFLNTIFLSPLYLLSLIYGAIVKARLILYSLGLLKAGRLGCKVISVGNITVGGTGKTPTVEFIAGKLHERGFKVAVLSRGYKRKGKGTGIVSDGKTILLGPEDAGDEPYMLARRLKNVPVLVGSDRYELGRFALQRFPLDVVILDDGFQHIRLKRDLDILLVDGEKGFGNGRLLPRGPLREPLSGIGRAGLILINKASTENPEVEGDITSNHPHPVLFRSSYRAKGLVSLWKNGRAGLEILNGARVIAVSAIAEPSSFLNLLSSLGGRVVSEASFPDHHGYTMKDLEAIVEEAMVVRAEFIVTTEKDAVKLERLEPRTGVPVYYLEIGLDMHGGEQMFMDAVVSRIRG